MERRQTKVNERLVSCQCCGYPISQRHHLLEVSRFGENEYSYQLCPNCHELYHIIKDSRLYGNESRPAILLDRIVEEWGSDHIALRRLTKLVDLITDVEGKMVIVFKGVEQYKQQVQMQDNVARLVEEGYILIPPGYHHHIKDTCTCLHCEQTIDDPDTTYQVFRDRWLEKTGTDLLTHYMLIPPKEGGGMFYTIPADLYDIG